MRASVAISNNIRLFVIFHLRLQLKKIIVAALCLLVMCPVFSAMGPWESFQKKIRAVEIVGGLMGAPGNYTLRVYLKEVDHGQFCAGSNDDWGYLNGSDASYKPMAAALMMAQATGKTVVFFKAADGAGHCAIGDIVVVTD